MKIPTERIREGNMNGTAVWGNCLNMFTKFGTPTMTLSLVLIKVPCAIITTGDIQLFAGGRVVVTPDSAMILKRDDPFFKRLMKVPLVVCPKKICFLPQFP